LTILLSLLHASAVAHAVSVFPAGQDALLSRMLGEDLPRTCQWTGASVTAQAARATYLCGDGPPLVLELFNADAQVKAAASTERFLLRPGVGFPPPLLAAIAASVRRHEAQWPASGSRIGDSQGQFRVLAAVGALCCLAVALFLVGWRKRKIAMPPVAREPCKPVSPLAILAALGAVSFLVVAATHMHFQAEDYRFMLRAARDPWEADDSLGVLSTSTLYYVGAQLGHAKWFYATCNLAVLTAIGTAVALLLRRVGRSPSEAVLAAALAMVGPGAFELVTWAAGFQQLAVTAIVLAVLLGVDTAARTSTEAPAALRAARILLPLALTGIATLVKLAVCVVIPILSWVWCRLVVHRPTASLRWHAFHLAFFGVIIGAFYLGNLPTTGGDIGKAGVSNLALNVRSGASMIAPWLLLLGMGVVAAVAVGAAWRWARRRHADADASPSTVQAHHGRNAALVGSAAILSAVGLSPFLFMTKYAMPQYYLFLMYIPLAAIAAALMTRSCPRSRAGGWVAAVLVVPVILPWGELSRAIAPSQRSQSEARVEEIRTLLTAGPRPRSVVLEAACPTEKATEAARVSLTQVLLEMGQARGVQWATGWTDLEMSAMQTGKAAEVRLFYCHEIVPNFYRAMR